MVAFKSLASWKAWWSNGEVAQQVASAICHYVDTTKLPGGGKLVDLASSTKVSETDFKNTHVSQLAEALIPRFLLVLGSFGCEKGARTMFKLMLWLLFLVLFC